MDNNRRLMRPAMPESAPRDVSPREDDHRQDRFDREAPPMRQDPRYANPRQDRHERHDRHDRHDRHERHDRHDGDRNRGPYQNRQNHQNNQHQQNRFGGQRNFQPRPSLDLTFAESFYYLKQMKNRTPMTVKLLDGEEVHGIIEWYDRDALKLVRANAPNIVVPKRNIKYIFKDEHAATEDSVYQSSSDLSEDEPQPSNVAATPAKDDSAPAAPRRGRGRPRRVEANPGTSYDES